MIENIPTYISFTFVMTTLLTLLISYWVMHSSDDEWTRYNAFKILMLLIGWLTIQGFISIKQVYSEDTNSIPPKIFLFGVLPCILCIIALFATKKGRRLIDSLPLKQLTYLNIVRIPVEFVLFYLYLHKAIPGLLTFEGWNYDILMGLSAPIVIYYGFIKKKWGRKALLLWNVLGILLLLFVFILAILSSPFPLQQFAFDQPNTGLLKFPFAWLPTFIVPLVIIGHLISIRQLKGRTSSFL